jgi:hypothetical protein
VGAKSVRWSIARTNMPKSFARRGPKPSSLTCLTWISVRSALEGVTAAYFVYRIQNTGLIDATAFMAQASKEAGAKAILNMSQISARREAKNHAARDFWISEGSSTGLESRRRTCGQLSLPSGFSTTGPAGESRKVFFVFP